MSGAAFRLATPGGQLTPADPGRSDPAAAPGGRASSAPLLGGAEEPTVFELSAPGRRSASFRTSALPEWGADELIPESELRAEPPALAEISERDLVGHLTRLAHRQYSVDMGAYPLGSCTMKYNPKLCDEAAALPGLTGIHPATPAVFAQGWLELLWSLGWALCRITGMHAATLQPPAGAAGELTGLLIMRAAHRLGGRSPSRILIPDSAHGTNPASVSRAGYVATSVPSDSRGLVSTATLGRYLGEDVAGMMLTNPNTLGLFEEDVAELAEAVHGSGGLMYYDGANLNAILGVTRPGDMGFDIVHMNLHKTFAVPHGGGGPGAGPVAVTEELAGFLPGPVPVRLADGSFSWIVPERSIGRVHGWYGNALALARAWAYILATGSDGLRRVSEAAVLNANWLLDRLRATYAVPFDRPCMHEVVVSTKDAPGARPDLSALDVAKRLLEEGFHSPTVYFPLIVPEAIMIEPTETESPETVAALAGALVAIATQGSPAPGAVPAPRNTPVGRPDEARAARSLIPTWDAVPR
ncbi:MAG TPA: aminomethyl-transferring glycine dehydrogenase subunit GcvPB [Acidimicrobiales bacterium]|nr:aminomethyl-transferring glycine dehydrogenase subunit GcvPB [Acidimicrobiales bacterium]